MEGPALFAGDVKYRMKLHGSVSGKKFEIKGEGLGTSEKGYQKGKFVCAENKPPISWPALMTTLGYGYNCFTFNPSDISHFYQDCMPEGYRQTRTITFENEGVITADHKIYYKDGVVHNDVTMSAEGFKEDSPVIKEGIRNSEPSNGTTFAWNGGLRTLSPLLYPLKSPANPQQKYIYAMVDTLCTPLGDKDVKTPDCYHVHSHFEQLQDIHDDRFHVVQHEMMHAYGVDLLGNVESPVESK